MAFLRSQTSRNDERKREGMTEKDKDFEGRQWKDRGGWRVDRKVQQVQQVQKSPRGRDLGVGPRCPPPSTTLTAQLPHPRYGCAPEFGPRQAPTDTGMARPGVVEGLTLAGPDLGRAGGAGGGREDSMGVRPPRAGEYKADAPACSTSYRGLAVTPLPSVGSDGSAGRDGWRLPRREGARAGRT
jgi:hypothetical protein